MNIVNLINKMYISPEDIISYFSKTDKFQNEKQNVVDNTSKIIVTPDGSIQLNKNNEEVKKLYRKMVIDTSSINNIGKKYDK